MRRDLSRGGFLLLLLLGLGRTGRAEDAFHSNLGLLELLTNEAIEETADELALSPGSTVTIVGTSPHEGNEFVKRRLAQVLTARGHTVRIVPSEPPPPKPEGTTTPPKPGGGVPTGNTPTQGAGTSTDSPAETSGGAGAGAPDSAAVDPFGDENLEVEESDATQDEEVDLSEPEGSSPAENQTTQSTAGTATSNVPPGMALAREEAKAAPSFPVYPAGDVLDVQLLEFGVSYADAGRKLLFGPLRFTRIGGTYVQVSHLRGPEGELVKVVSAERHQVDRLTGKQRILSEGATYPFTPPEMKAPGLGRYVEPAVVVGIVASLVYLFYTNQN